MDTIKLKSAEEYVKELEYNLKEYDFISRADIKEIQRNAIEYALTLASENADADINFIGKNREDYNLTSNDYEVYVINSSITSLKDKIFKENNL